MTSLVSAGVVATTALPVLAWAAGTPLRRSRPAAALVAVLGALATLATASLTLLAVDLQAPPSVARLVEVLPGLQTGGLTVPLAQQVDGPVALVAFVVALVTFAVQVFAVWYLRTDDRYPVFAATVSLFAGAMLVLVTSADLVLTLLGWEVMGWCSYLLIGHWSRREAARRAAQKAFLVTRLADVGFVLGVVVLATGPGSTGYPAVLAHWSAAGADGAMRSVGLVLLVVGVLGKSAQAPFQDWLPDAMEGPTPASALIHAATMVAAGTFVLAQLAPVLVLSDPARWVLAVSVAVTMLAAAVLAYGQGDVKRMLAWSTVSQVAIMLSALTVGPAQSAASAATLHLYGHALFKALLFLTLGWLGLVVGGTAVGALRGAGRLHPLGGVAWTVGLLALAGVPLTVGGVSKEHVVASVEAAVSGGGLRPLVVQVALLATVVATAAYATRAHLVLGRGEPAVHVRPAADARAGDPVGAGGTVVTGAVGPVRVAPAPGVLVVVGGLTVLTLVGGLVTATGLLPASAEVPAETVLLSLVLILLGVIVPLWGGAAAAAPVDAAAREAGTARWRVLAAAGLGADRAYLAAVARPVLALARLVRFLDTDVVDAYVRGGVVATRAAGGLGRLAHAAERASTGLVWVALGALVLAGTGVLLWS